MTAIHIRGLDEEVKRRLIAQAERHGRSMEAEARAILDEGTRPRNIALALREAALECGGLDDLALPSRDDEARVVEFE